MPTLSVLQGADRGQRFHTSHEPAILGRTGAHFKLSDTTISRRHAEIRPLNGDWILEDLNSSNGTYLNGLRLHEPVKLKHGDQIRMGSTLLVFGGEESVERLSGANLPRDLIDIDAGSGNIDSSILSALPTSDQSVILAAPETADAVHAWNMMYRIAEMIGDVLTIDEFLERLSDIICDHFVVDRIFILMRDAESDEMRPRVLRYRTSEKQERPTVTTSHSIIQHVLETRHGVLCANAMTDERFVTSSSHGSIHRLGLRSVICAPIIAHEDVEGIIHLDCPMAQHTYAQEHLRHITAVGRLAGMAIENIGLLQERMRTERLAAVGEAAAYLSHHIRNILQGLRSGGDVLELGIKRRDFGRVATAWKMVQRNLDRIFQMTTNLLTFSKDRRPDIVTAQLNAVVREAVDLMQGPADAKNIMLLADLGDLPPIPLDLDGMHQVTVNLLHNAIAAVPAESGRIVVTTAHDSQHDQAVLTVADNGPGIPEAERKSMFEPFHSTKGHGGTGLGLAAASKIVAELRGEIGVDDESGEGATIVVRLPASLPHATDEDSSGTMQPKAEEPLDQTTVMSRDRQGKRPRMM